MKNKIFLLINVFLLLISNLFAQSNQNPVSEASLKLKSNDLNGAIAILDKAIAKKPTYFEAYEFRAYIYSLTNNYPNAVKDISVAIELSSHGELYKKRAFYRQMSGDLMGALNDYNVAIEKGVESADVFNARAKLKRLTNDLDGMEEDYLLALKIRPHFAAAANGYAGVLSIRGKQQEAINYLEQFLTKIEKDWNYNFPNPKVETVKGKELQSEPFKDNDGQAIMAISGTRIVSQKKVTTIEEAEKDRAEMEQILNIGVCYSTLARMYEKENELEKASFNIKKAFNLNPTGIGLYDIRGRIRLKQGDYDGAIFDFTKALETTPVAQGNLADRGIAYLLKADNEKAQKDFEKYLQQYPKAKENLDERIEEAKKSRKTHP